MKFWNNTDRKKSRLSFVVGGLFVVLVTIVTFAWSVTRKPVFITSLSIGINRVEQKADSTYYQYDGYYALQASDIFSQTLLSWFVTPSVLLDVYTKARVDPRITSLGQLNGRFRAKKLSAQNIIVQYTEKERTTAEKIAAAIAEIVQQRGNALNTNPQGTGTFSVVPAQPVVVETKPNAPLNAAVAFVGSAILVFAVFTGQRYLSA